MYVYHHELPSPSEFSVEQFKLGTCHPDILLKVTFMVRFMKHFSMSATKGGGVTAPRAYYA